MADAQREADEHVAQVRREAEEQAARVLQKEQAVSAEREEAARAEAERAQQEAHERFTEATERLARARELADEAAALAQDAAERARQDAERISAVAREGRQQADAAVTQAVRLREHTEEEAAQVTRKVNHPATLTSSRTTSGTTSRKQGTARRRQSPSALATMSKSELLHLAQERGVPGRSGMSKKQLVTALEKKQ